MARTTTLSSLGVSSTLLLNPVSKSTIVQVTVASGSSGSNIFAQMTLDNPNASPPQTATWSNISSAITSSLADGGGVVYTILSPIYGLRLSSTTTVTGTVSLKAQQAVTA